MITSRLHVARRTLRSLHGPRYLSSQQSVRGSGGSALVSPWLGAAVLVVATSTLVGPSSNPVALDSRPIRGGDVVSVGTPTKDPATGILFPQMCNGYYLAGVGHRVKYVFVKVYGVASYFDPLAMSAVKNNPAALEQALLDPTYPRTIQIVMARGLSADKFTAGIVESLEPRMKGKDLDKLEEFKKMNPAVDLVQGATIEMTIRGDTLMYKNAMGTVGSIRSEAFTSALCDTYFGSEAVSPTLKESVLEGIPKL